MKTNNRTKEEEKRYFLFSHTIYYKNRTFKGEMIIVGNFPSRKQLVEMIIKSASEK